LSKSAEELNLNGKTDITNSAIRKCYSDVDCDCWQETVNGHRLVAGDLTDLFHACRAQTA